MADFNDNDNYSEEELQQDFQSNNDLDADNVVDAEASITPDYKIPDPERKSVIGEMFRQWYLEYASYVILERAVPNIDDGLKPVQRRILHSMQTLDDGQFNKVANIVGNTMQYHPHGDASIADALVQLGQKELLIDTQGNFGNILTGDSAAASRYIEARLSEFALETVFNPKITEWTPSYDGRKNEPVTLPVKFPLLLAQGVEGIAVGLSSKILPHNFNEICDAAVDALEGREFQLFPDFATGGLLDVSRYKDGARGGNVRVRAKIEKIDNKTLAITEIPFGKTTSTLITSILAAVDKGKIKIRKVDDNTAATAEIIVHLQAGTSSDKAIDALYAFTDCEISISPNCCVIQDKKPYFLSVSEVLNHNVMRTKDLLRKELEIKLSEANEARMFSSLEKIFIEERIYKDKQLEEAKDMDTAVAHVNKRLEPFKPSFFREVTTDDIMHLWEIKMARILKFNSQKADEKIAALTARIEEMEHNLAHLTEFTIAWFRHLKSKYGASFPRRTQLRAFDSIQATKVAEANKRLYFDRAGGFVGTSLKDAEFLFNCSDIDDIIIIYKDGKYKLVKVSEKLHIGNGKKVLHIGLFKKNDSRTTYNVVYRNGGKDAYSYKKRFHITGLTRDKDYDITKGETGSKIEYMTVNPNGEAEVVKVYLKNEPNETGRRPRVKEVVVDFAELSIKGKESLGNLVTKYQIEKIKVEEEGRSTLGGREVWFDRDVLRLNYDGRGESLGTFQGDDKVLVITKNGEFFTSNYSDENHYDDNILRIEKFDSRKVWTLALSDDTQGYPYLKRFTFEESARPQRFVGADDKSKIILLTDTPFPHLQLIFNTEDGARAPQELEADEFIGVKSFKAKGKRLTIYSLDSIVELEPLKFPEPEPEVVTEESATLQDSENQSKDDDGNQLNNESQQAGPGDLFEFIDDEA